MAQQSRFLLSSNWARDLSKNGSSDGEIKDVEVINQSIESILSTSYGERLFNLSYGSSLPRKVFENIDASFAEGVLDDCAAAIKRWEDRVTVISSEMRVIQNADQNSVIIVIPYIINKTRLGSIFKKKIVSF